MYLFFNLPTVMVTALTFFSGSATNNVIVSMLHTVACELMSDETVLEMMRHGLWYTSIYNEYPQGNY